MLFSIFHDVSFIKEMGVGVYFEIYGDFSIEEGRKTIETRQKTSKEQVLHNIISI